MLHFVKTNLRGQARRMTSDLPPRPLQSKTPSKISMPNGKYTTSREFECWWNGSVKIHGTPPSEAELQQYFRVSPSSVHQMILTLERRGLIERTAGQARSIHLLISCEELPDLIEVHRRDLDEPFT